MSRRLVGIEPWSSNGPGWSNSGLTLLWEQIDSPRQIETETIYREDLRGTSATLFPHLLALYGEVKRECERGRAGKPR